MLRLDDLVAIIEGSKETKGAVEIKHTVETESTRVDDLYESLEETKVSVEQKKDGEEVKLKLEDLTKLATVDHLHNNQLLKWLKQEKLIDQIQSIYYCENSKDVIIAFNDHKEATELAVKLMNLLITQLGRTEFTPEELSKAVLPNKFLSSLLGFKYIPFEKDVLNTDGTPVDHNIVNLSGNIELKFPYLLDTKEEPYAPKVLYYILKRLEKGITKELFDNPEKLPTLEELLKILPNELPADAAALFKRYEELGILRLQPSRTAKGFTRILTDNFEAMLKGLLVLPGDKDFIKEICEKLRKTMPVVGVDAFLLNKLLTKQFGDAPSVRLGKPKTFGKQWLMPCELSIPCATSNLPEYTVMFLDISGSMKGSRLDALKKALVNKTLGGLASRPNQKLSVITYDHNAYSIIKFEDLNQDTLERNKAKIQQLETNGCTSIIPALRMFKEEHLVEAQKCAELLAPDCGAQLPITVLLVTDGVFDDTEEDIAKEIAELSHCKITWKCVGLDLTTGGKPERCLSMFVKDSLQNKRPGQLIFAPCEEIDSKIRQLILGDAEGAVLEGINVKYHGAADEVLGSCSLSGISSGKSTFCNLTIPRGVYEFIPYAPQMGLCTIPMSIQFNYTGGSKKLIRSEIPCDALLKPLALEGFDKTHYIQNEWIQSRLLAEHIKADDEKFDLLLKLYQEACEMHDKELVEEVLKNLKPFIRKFRDTFVDCAYPSKKKKLQFLQELCRGEEAAGHDLLVEILKEEILKLESDLILVLEDFLFKEANVSDNPEFEQKSLGEQLAAYTTLELKIRGGLITLPKGVDGKALYEQLTARIDAIWHDASICIEGNCKNMAEFAAFPVIKRFGILNNVKEKAAGFGKKTTSEQLQTEMDAIWLEAMIVQVSEDKYGSLSVYKKLDVLHEIKRLAESLSNSAIRAEVDQCINAVHIHARIEADNWISKEVVDYIKKNMAEKKEQSEADSDSDSDAGIGAAAFAGAGAGASADAAIAADAPIDASLNKTQKATARARYRLKSLVSKEQLIFNKMKPLDQVDLLNKILVSAEVQSKAGELDPKFYQVLLERVREKQRTCMGLKDKDPVLFSAAMAQSSSVEDAVLTDLSAAAPALDSVAKAIP